MEHAQGLLHRLSQRRRSGRRRGVRRCSRFRDPGQAQSLRGRGAQAARRPDAAARKPAARPSADRRVHHGNGARDRPRRPGTRCGARAGATAEPHGIRGQRQGAARRRDRREAIPAERDRGRRLRQHRGRAQRVARVPRAVHWRRAQSGAARSRRGDAKAAERVLPAAARQSGQLRRRNAARHTRRHLVQAPVPVGRRVPLHDHGSRRRTLSARARNRADARDAARPQGGVPREARRQRGPRARRPRRRARTRRDHAAVRGHSGAGYCRRARADRHVHRACARIDRRADRRLHALRRL